MYTLIKLLLLLYILIVFNYLIYVIQENIIGEYTVEKSGLLLTANQEKAQSNVTYINQTSATNHEVSSASSSSHQSTISSNVFSVKNFF